LADCPQQRGAAAWHRACSARAWYLGARASRPAANLPFSHKFVRAEQAIDELHEMTSMQKGSWIFRRHVYSRSDLFKATQFEKVYSVIQKIGSDVHAWNRQGVLTEDARLAYRKARERVSRRLRAIRNGIRHRRPIGVEKFIEFFDGFIATVVDLLPTLSTLAKTSVKLVSSKALAVKLLTSGV
jgi:hypothetical protein